MKRLKEQATIPKDKESVFPGSSGLASAEPATAGEPKEQSLLDLLGDLNLSAPVGAPPSPFPPIPSIPQSLNPVPILEPVQLNQLLPQEDMLLQAQSMQPILEFNPEPLQQQLPPPHTNPMQIPAEIELKSAADNKPVDLFKNFNQNQLIKIQHDNKPDEQEQEQEQEDDFFSEIANR